MGEGGRGYRKYSRAYSQGANCVANRVFSYSVVCAEQVLSACFGVIFDRVLGQGHTLSIAFRHLPPNSARFGYATRYLRAAVHRRGQRPPKGSGTDKTVEAP